MTSGSRETLESCVDSWAFLLVVHVSTHTASYHSTTVAEKGHPFPLRRKVRMEGCNGNLQEN